MNKHYDSRNDSTKWIASENENGSRIDECHVDGECLMESLIHLVAFICPQSKISIME